MLRQEQAAELLMRCERIAGCRLNQVRGNLRNAESRSAAVWELLVLEEAANLGNVEYEPVDGGSPDIKLTLPNGSVIWIEVAFLYPRFWKEERATDAVAKWMRDEAERKGISRYKLGFRFDGDQKNPSGPVRRLPALHERRAFVNSEYVRKFFASVKATPRLPLQYVHPEYSVKFTYDPSGKGPFVGFEGLVQEVPRTVKQHSVYRLIKKKSRQHDLVGKRLICVGSDQSNVMPTEFGTHHITPEDAIGAAFRETRSLSAVILVNVTDNLSVLQGLTRKAEAVIYRNPRSKVQLKESDLTKLMTLNFNRWDYSFRLEKYEPSEVTKSVRMSGSLVMSIGHNSIQMEIPSSVLVQVLAGTASFRDSYPFKENEAPFKQLREGWKVVGCSYKSEEIEQGKASVVVLELSPPSERVYWPD